MLELYGVERLENGMIFYGRRKNITFNRFINLTYEAHENITVEETEINFSEKIFRVERPGYVRRKRE